MKVTYRFILKSYVGPMVLTFFIVMFILLVQFMWRYIEDLVGKGLSFNVILELIMYATITMMPMGLPLSTLLASIMTMGNLGENNELLALKSAGISLPRIMKPLIILILFVCIGSYFVINNLTPYAYKQMFSLLNDINRQRQTIEFKDGIFFNGIQNMSIRVEHQEANGKLNNVLIYNTINPEKMQTTVADSGYIRITDDRKYLSVRLFDGQMYEKNRDYRWFNHDTLTYHTFKKQELLLALDGFAFERGDDDQYNFRSETKTITELAYSIDSLYQVQDSVVTSLTTTLLKGYIFKRYNKFKSVDSIPNDSVMKQMSYLVHKLDTMNVTDMNKVFSTAKQWANDANNFVGYRTSNTAYTSEVLYRAQIEYQRKLVLPFSILIFFLIGAPLGAIIRKGGLGMPILISIGFFVSYYIISIVCEKAIKDGAISAVLGMWLPSVILFPIAIFLTYKSTNDSKLFNIDNYKKLIKPITYVLYYLWSLVIYIIGRLITRYKK